MTAMSAALFPAAPGFSRRRLLAASSAGLALLAAGCTSSSTPARDQVTDRQADALAAQVTVQEGVVAAYAAAAAADAALGTRVADLAGQARDQLSRLRAAAPRSGPSGSPTAGPAPSPAPPAGADVRPWLRDRVTAAADSHATACLGQTGARAALLGSVAAGLRGQAGRLA
jgi:hypothetical protein